ncbi:MAG: flavodoxin domain-containing protein [Peptostreptococcaceae bacterium]
MKTLIVFGSNYGSTEECAKMLKNYIGQNCEVINVNNIKNTSLNKYENIIIGSPVYAGMFNKEIKEFIENNKDELINKKIGLFMCCMSNGEKINEQFEANLPKEILNNAVIKENFGGEFNFSKMNFLERSIVKMIAKKDKSLGKVDGKSNINIIDNDLIQQFAKCMEV